MSLYPIGKALTNVLVQISFRMQYEGLEHIPPKSQGYILASNHRSNFDPLMIAHKVPSPLFFMAKMELFRNPIFGWILRSVNAFPIDRGSGDTGAMDQATAIIRSGGTLVIFPEGHRSLDGKPLRARSGVGALAAQTGADVLPCAVCFEGRTAFRKTITVRYGPLIPNAQLQLDVENPRTFRAASKMIMEKIAELLGLGDY